MYQELVVPHSNWDRFGVSLSNLSLSLCYRFQRTLIIYPDSALPILTESKIVTWTPIALILASTSDLIIRWLTTPHPIPQPYPRYI